MLVFPPLWSSIRLMRHSSSHSMLSVFSWESPVIPTGHMTFLVCSDSFPSVPQGTVKQATHKLPYSFIESHRPCHVMTGFIFASTAYLSVHLNALMIFSLFMSLTALHRFCQHDSPPQQTTNVP